MPKDSKTRILDVALQEFSEHGYGGARVNHIAKRSKANKQLIYYYFTSKQGLYDAVRTRVYEELAAVEAAVPKEVEKDLAYWVDFHFKHPSLIRLLEWDGLKRGNARSKKGSHAGYWQGSLQRLRQNQAAGGWPPSISAEQLLIASVALATWPLVFPTICREITGMDPDDPKFLEARLKFIRAFGAALKAL